MKNSSQLKFHVFLIYFTFLAIISIACSAEVPPKVPTNWQLTEASEAFSLHLPPGWNLRELQGIDSYVGEIAGDDVRLQFDYGWYSNSLAEDNDPDHDVSYEDIDGRRAKLVRPKEGSGGITGVYFEQVNSEESGFGVNRLAISGTGLTNRQQETAFTIFRTIRFPS